jgi:hypothetical protein
VIRFHDVFKKREGEKEPSEPEPQVEEPKEEAPATSLDPFAPTGGEGERTEVLRKPRPEPEEAPPDEEDVYQPGPGSDELASEMMRSAVDRQKEAVAQASGGLMEVTPEEEEKEEKEEESRTWEVREGKGEPDLSAVETVLAEPEESEEETQVSLESSSEGLKIVVEEDTPQEPEPPPEAPQPRPKAAGIPKDVSQALDDLLASGLEVAKPSERLPAAEPEKEEPAREPEPEAEGGEDWEMSLDEVLAKYSGGGSTPTDAKTEAVPRDEPPTPSPLDEMFPDEDGG